MGSSSPSVLSSSEEDEELHSDDESDSDLQKGIAERAFDAGWRGSLRVKRWRCRWRNESAEEERRLELLRRKLREGDVQDLWRARDAQLCEKTSIGVGISGEGLRRSGDATTGKPHP